MRGRYRILLGTAAGVGKSYRMLLEGRQSKVAGSTWSSATSSRTTGRRPPPSRTGWRSSRAGVEHGGLVLEELDADAVIRRAPQVALIDELAHTNAPGSRNTKRYEDIDEVLAAGIDVVSTVNVQHLESLNDAIST